MEERTAGHGFMWWSLLGDFERNEKEAEMIELFNNRIPMSVPNEIGMPLMGTNLNSRNTRTGSAHK